MVAEFQAVILAGGEGERLFPLTESTHKAMLPLANRPMVAYSLDALERIGFDECICVVRKKQENAVSNFIESKYNGQLAVKIVAVPDEYGTADSLRAIASKITGDFIALSCDLVTDVEVRHVIDVHRTHEATVTVLYREADKEAKKTDTKKKGAAQLVDVDTDYIGIDGQDPVKGPARKIRLLIPGGDVDGHIIKPKGVLRRYPNLNLRSDLHDSHLHVFSHYVLEFLDREENKRISSIRDELIPKLIRRQHLQVEGMNSRKDEGQAYELSLKQNDRQNISCWAYIADNVICQRANTLATYTEVNRLLAKGLLPLPPLSYVVDKPKDDGKQIGAECLVGDDMQLGEKSVVKKSTIGSHVIMGPSSRVLNSIIFDHVTIGDNCELDGCIVANNVRIEDGCKLKECQIGAEYVVEEKSVIKNEVLCFERD